MHLAASHLLHDKQKSSLEVCAPLDCQQVEHCVPAKGTTVGVLYGHWPS